MKTPKCKRCGGTGIEPDQPKIASDMREKRLALGLTLATLSQHLGISAAFLSDMEHGKRAWSPERVSAIQQLHKTATEGKPR